MSEKEKQRIEKPHSLSLSNGILTVSGVVRVVAISEKEAQLKLYQNTLFVKGTGLNIVRLQQDQGEVVVETQSLQSLCYRPNGLSLKGIFR